MRIGVFCSGGDAPGMNACVRAVVRAAVSQGHEVVGILNGYQGLLDRQFFGREDGLEPMSLRSVSDWSRQGGARLRSSRSPEFQTEAGMRKAVEVLQSHQIDALIPIGGDGTLRGALDFSSHWSGPIVGCPGTIDNDLIGTDYTIGFATAVQTAVEAVDKIRDTAESHQRMFLIEVMGRHSGFLAVYTALAAAAETVCIPETATDIQATVADLERLKLRGKNSIMMIVAEGDERGGAEQLQCELADHDCPFPTRVVVLGHLQRGGTPNPEDRILASQLGNWAVEALLEGNSGVMVGRINGDRALTPFAETFAAHKPIPQQLLKLVDCLAK